jgi:hypothetical protein
MDGAVDLWALWWEGVFRLQRKESTAGSSTADGLYPKKRAGSRAPASVSAKGRSVQGPALSWHYGQANAAATCPTADDQRSRRRACPGHCAFRGPACPWVPPRPCGPRYPPACPAM